MIKKISCLLLLILLFNSTVLAENIIIKTEEDLNTLIQSKKPQTVVIIGRLEKGHPKSDGVVYVESKPIYIVPYVKFLKEEISISKFYGKFVELKGYIEDVTYSYEQISGFYITSIESINEIENIKTIKTEKDLKAIGETESPQEVIIIGRIERSTGKSYATVYVGTKPIPIPNKNVFKEEVEISQFYGKYVELKGEIENPTFHYKQIIGPCIISIESIKIIKDIENN